jgi:hypothetical protein
MWTRLGILTVALAALCPDPGLLAQPTAFMADALALRGSIDRYPITLFLNRHGEHLAGHYWYDRTGEPISVYGTLDKGVARLEASTRNEDDKGEVFLLKPSGAGWTGTWTHRSTGRMLPVTLSVRQDIPPMRTLHFTDSTRALKGRAEPMARFQATVCWPTGTSPREAFIRQEILGCLGTEGDMAADPIAKARAARTAYFAEYAGQVKAVLPAEILEMPQSFTWSRDIRVSPASLAGDLLSLDGFMYEYTGGAHGLGASQYKVLDLAKLRVMRQGDLLTDEGIRALPRLLEKHFRRIWKVQPGTKLDEAGLLVDRIEAETYNFFLTERAVIFSFAPYEIAAYAYGEVQIAVPFVELKPYLRPAYAYLAGPAAR